MIGKCPTNMPGSYGKSVPLHERSTLSICFGIVWCVAIGSYLLYRAWTLLLPWHLTLGAALLLGVVALFESICFAGVWASVRELRRRRKKS